jgi:hypothetical protein
VVSTDLNRNSEVGTADSTDFRRLKEKGTGSCRLHFCSVRILAALHKNILDRNHRRFLKRVIFARI